MVNLHTCFWIIFLKMVEITFDNWYNTFKLSFFRSCYEKTDLGAGRPAGVFMIAIIFFHLMYDLVYLFGIVELTTPLA